MWGFYFLTFFLTWTYGGAQFSIILFYFILWGFFITTLNFTKYSFLKFLFILWWKMWWFFITTSKLDHIFISYGSLYFVMKNVRIFHHGVKILPNFHFLCFSLLCDEKCKDFSSQRQNLIKFSFLKFLFI